jgi:hypothetical protein
VTAYTCSERGAPGVNGQSTLLSWRSGDHGNSTSARFFHAWNADVTTADPTESITIIVMPVAGILQNMSVTSGGITPTANYTIRINGVDTAITVPLATTATSGSDTTHTATVTVGDSITVKSITSVADATAVYPGVYLEYAAA